MRAFPASALSSLGHDIVERYYLALLPQAPTFLVHESRSGIDGFVVGGRLQDTMGAFLDANRWLLVARVLTRPHVLRASIARRRIVFAARFLRKRLARPSSSPSHVAPSCQQAAFRCLSIAVDPAARRQGVGKTLMAELMAAAHRTGARTIRLSVDPSNTGAIRFYEADGWQRVHLYASWFDSSPTQSWWGAMEKTLMASGGE